MPLRLLLLIFGMKPVFLGSFFLLAGFFFVAAIGESLWWRFNSFQCKQSRKKKPAGLGRAKYGGCRPRKVYRRSESSLIQARIVGYPKDGALRAPIVYQPPEEQTKAHRWLDVTDPDSIRQ